MKFAELVALPNVFQNYDPKAPKLVGQNLEEVELKGQWNKEYFKNGHPIVLELACGRGEYTLGMADMYEGKNFIGVDVKGARIWKGATYAHEQELKNVAFLRSKIEQIDLFFDKEEVDEIWITFPDPFLRDSKENRRLTSPAFLKRYRNILKEGGHINLKTDSPELFEFTMNVLTEDPQLEIIYTKEDIYSAPLAYPELALKTYYERMHLADGRTIKFVKFRFKK